MSILTNQSDLDLSSGSLLKQRSDLFVAAIVAAGSLLALYFFLPYQHGHYETRTSVIRGLYLLVITPTGSEWFFCLLVPFITALLVYLRRDTLKNVPIRGSSWGLGILVFSLLLFWLGYRADTRYLGYASAQLSVSALIIWFLGWRYMHLLFFPWIFLAFTWPFLPLEEILAFPLRIIAAESSAIALNVLGVDCFREGTSIISSADPENGLKEGGFFSLDVDNPCSGIRSLFSLIMISVFYGYISLTKVWQRLTLFAAAIPLAVAGNVVRMLLLAFGCIFFGVEFAVGTEHPSTYHQLSGIAVFIVALAGMFSLSGFLELRNPFRRRSGTKKKKKKKPSPSSDTPAGPGAIPYWRSAVVVTLCGLTAITCLMTPEAKGLSEPGVTPTLPQSFGTYWGQSIPATKAEQKGLLVYGVELSRFHYQSASSPPITATVIVGGPESRTLHRPEVCLPGQGWRILGSRQIEVDLGLPGGSPTGATLLTVTHGEPSLDGGVAQRKALNLYWYIGNNCTAGSYNEHITRSLYDGTVHNLHHRWSMVSLFHYMPLGDSTDPLAEQELIEAMEEVARGIVPSIKNGPWR